MKQFSWGAYFRGVIFSGAFFRGAFFPGAFFRTPSIPYETRKPIILKWNHVLTKLIVADCHYRIKHNGERHTLSEVRKEYWIPRGKSYIKLILYHCILCRRLSSRPYNYPRSPNLPLTRVQDSYPFICTGIDYTARLARKKKASAWSPLASFYPRRVVSYRWSKK